MFLKCPRRRKCAMYVYVISICVDKENLIYINAGVLSSKSIERCNKKKCHRDCKAHLDLQKELSIKLEQRAMTRFARASGSKSSNEKVPEEATSWHEIKQQLRAKVDNARNSERMTENEGTQDVGKSAKVCREGKLIGSERCFWAEFSTTHDNKNTNTSKIIKPKDLFQNSTSKPSVIPTAYVPSFLVNGSNNKINSTKSDKKRRNSVNNVVLSVDSTTSFSIDGAAKQSKLRPDHAASDFKNIVSFQGFNVRQKDAERLKLIKPQLSDSNFEKKDVAARIKQRRKTGKTLSQGKKEVCFNCRKPGHILLNCPNLESSETQESVGAGICFKCGSTEHKLSQCRISGQQEFQYAQCFICNQLGHIAKECPDNPRGLYPHGGACKVCGDVTHLKKDCPRIVCRNNDPKFMLGTINCQSIEGLDEEIHQSVKTKKELVKKHIIKF